MFEYFPHTTFMARTVYKNKMDSFFTTQLALDELEFPSLAAGGGDLTNFDNDDVFSDVLKGIADRFSRSDFVAEAPDFSAQDLFDELDFQDGWSLVDMGWMTEKVDFRYEGATLSAEETITDLFTMSNIDIPLPDASQSFETPQENLTSGADLVSKIKDDSPTSPEQKVPDFLVSLVSVPSPGSVSSVESGVLSPNSQGACSLPSSPHCSQETELPTAAQQTKPLRSPYSRGPQSPGVRPKVKTPEQRERKRVQNKDAATRYRIKKRDEQGLFVTEVDGLEKTNTELKEQVSSLSKEIEYLKNLMLEVYKVKLQNKAMQS